MSEARERRVFISYSRRDDEAFAEWLRDRLTTAGFAVWWDRQSMQSRGLTFLQEIQDAIVDAERLILVVGPTVPESRYVEWEWRLAARECIAVTPVLRNARHAPCLFEVHCPHELKTYDYVDFRTSRDEESSLARLIAHLSVAPAEPGALHGVPELPPAWVAREENLEAVARLVHPDATEPTVISSAMRSAALHGMGGIGKSTLAAAFARRCATRRFFSHGIIWAVFGRDPDVTAICSRLAYALGDSSVANDLTPAQALESLAGLLRKRRCLLVLDDVWEPDHVASFCNIQTPSRLLITSRNASLGRSTGASEHRLDVLPLSTALDVLLSWAAVTDGAGRGDAAPEAAQIVEECGRLPLALAMIGSMVRAGSIGWPTALRRLQTHQLGDIRDRLPSYDHPDLLRAVAVSVDALSETERRRYLELCVFPEDAVIPLDVLERFWHTPRHDVGHLLDLFIDRSLARRVEGGIVLHDLQRDYVRAVTGDDRPLQRALLNACRPPRGWYDLSEGDYFFGRLIQHLNRAGLHEEIHELVTGETRDGGNAWYRRKGQAHPGRYLADLRDVRSTTPPTDLGRHALYAVMEASVRSAQRALPPILLKALVAAGMWTVERAASRVRLLPVAQRARGLIQIASAAPLDELERILPETIDSIRDGHDAFRDLIALAAALPERLPGGILDQLVAEARLRSNPIALALAAVRANEPAGSRLRVESLESSHDLRTRASCLAVFVRSAPGTVAAEEVGATFRAILGIERANEKAKALERMIPALDGADLVTGIRTFCSLLDSDNLHESPLSIARALGRVAAAVPPVVVPELVRQLPERGLRSTTAMALALMTPYLPLPMRRDAARRAFQIAIERSEMDAETAAELSLVAEHLDSAEVEGLLHAARDSTTQWRWRTLAAVARVLPPSRASMLVDEVIEGIRSADGWIERSYAIEEAAPSMPPDRLPDAVAAATRIDDPRAQLGSSLDLVPHADLRTRLEIYESILDLAARSSDEQRALDLELISEQLPDPMNGRAIEIARGVQEARYRIAALSALIPRDATLLAEADEALASIDGDAERGHALARLVRFRDRSQRSAAIDGLLPLLSAETNGERHAKSIGSIVPHAGERGTSIVEEAVRRHQDDGPAMRFIVPHIRLETLREYVSYLQFADEHDLLAALPEVVTRFCDLGEPAEAFAALKHIRRDVPARTRALAAIAPAMRIGDLLQAPAWLESLDNRYAAEPALVEVLAQLAAAGHSGLARQRAEGIADPVWQAAAFAGIAPSVADSLSLAERAVLTMEPLPFVEHRHMAVRKLAMALAALEPADAATLLVRLIAALCQTLRWNFIADLNTLAPAFARAGGTGAVAGLVRAARQSARWWS